MTIPTVSTNAKTEKTMRIANPELQAMAKIDEIMSGLPDLAVPRVLAWLVSTYAPAKSIVDEFEERIK